MENELNEGLLDFDSANQESLALGLIPFSFLFKNLMFINSDAYKFCRKEELKMALINDEIGYIGSVPGPGKVYVAGVGYVNAPAQQGTYVAGVGYVTPKAPGSWSCECGAENTGKFCQKCGKAKPDPKGTWTCSCGAKNTGKFCSECGQTKPEEWTCSCGHKNMGKFCNECGKAKPEEWICSCGHKNSGKFCSECGELSPAEKAKVAAPVVNETPVAVAPEPVVKEVKPEPAPAPVVEAAPVESAPVVAPGSWVCPACGDVNTTKFCQTCGMKQPEGAAAPEVAPAVSAPIVEEVKPEPAPVVEEAKPEPVVEAAPVEPAPAVAPGSWVCPACGEVNNTKFCQTCGTKQP